VSNHPTTNIEALIIGSGPCGVAVADTLCMRGINSVIFEAGVLPEVFNYSNAACLADYRQQLKTALAIDEDAWRYETNSTDYDWIRVRAGGGRTLRWNGWLAQPGYENFISPLNNQWQWPLQHDELVALWTRSHQWLNGKVSRLEPQFMDLAQQLSYTILPKTAALAEHALRPFCALDRLSWTNASKSKRAQIRFKAQSVVTRILCGRQGVEGVEYLDLGTGKSHRVKSNVVILSASTIETTRILLCSELEDYSESQQHIGAGYTDHIAASYLAILPDKFIGEAIGSPLDRSATIPNPKNAHRSPDQRGGYTIELHGPNPASIYEPEVLAAAGLDKIADSNVACISVNAIGELCSSPKRYVAISEQRDSLGRRIPRICIEWDAEVISLASAMEAEAELVAIALAGPTGRAIKVRETLTLGGTGTSHEASTCKMGINTHDSVVNKDGQVHGINGLFIADASIMPSGLDCHPSLTVVALALNSADGVTRYLVSR
jgi:choline dehydrogenase-like flavoprotein